MVERFVPMPQRKRRIAPGHQPRSTMDSVQSGPSSAWSGEEIVGWPTRTPRVWGVFVHFRQGAARALFPRALQIAYVDGQPSL